jgi:hypothetical protein
LNITLKSLAYAWLSFNSFWIFNSSSHMSIFECNHFVVLTYWYTPSCLRIF